MFAMNSVSSNGGRPTYNQVLLFLYAAGEREPRLLRHGHDLQRAAIDRGLLDRHDVSEFYDAIRSMKRDGLLVWGKTFGQPEYDPAMGSLMPNDFTNLRDLDLTAEGRRLAQQVLDGVPADFRFIPHVDAPSLKPRPNLDAHAAAAETSFRGRHFDQAVVSACALLEAACRDCLPDDEPITNKPALQLLAGTATRRALGIAQGDSSPMAKVASSVGGLADAVSKLREAHGRSSHDHEELTEAEARLCDSVAVALARYLAAVNQVEERAAASV